MQALFVHGMGRSPLSGWRLLRQLQRAGLKTSSFGYSVSLEDFAGIRRRLESRLSLLAERGDYVLIGHSLGGVLLRAAVNGLPPGTRRPRHLFLLGSPLRGSDLEATRLIGAAPDAAPMQESSEKLRKAFNAIASKASAAAASFVSTTSTPSSPICTVALPPAPTSM